jgi:uncharacterized membrane protein YozB (DUF420 family)
MPERAKEAAAAAAAYQPPLSRLIINIFSNLLGTFVNELWRKNRHWHMAAMLNNILLIARAPASLCERAYNAFALLAAKLATD